MGSRRAGAPNLRVNRLPPVQDHSLLYLIYDMRSVLLLVLLGQALFAQVGADREQKEEIRRLTEEVRRLSQENAILRGEAPPRFLTEETTVEEEEAEIKAEAEGKSPEEVAKA